MKTAVLYMWGYVAIPAAKGHNFSNNKGGYPFPVSGNPDSLAPIAYRVFLAIYRRFSGMPSQVGYWHVIPLYCQYLPIAIWPA